MKKKPFKKILSLILVITMMLSLVPLADITGNAENIAGVKMTGSNGVVNWDFIEPVIHQKTVPEGYTGIYTVEDLRRVQNNGNYILMNNINVQSDGLTIGSFSNPDVSFNGIFDGNGYVINGIDYSHNGDFYSISPGYYGLFCFVGVDGIIKNLGLTNTNINVKTSLASNYGGRSFYSVGAIVAYNQGKIENCFNRSGQIKINYHYYHVYVGGIVGYSAGGSITNCYNTGDISATSTAVSPTAVPDTAGDSSVGGIAGLGNGLSIVKSYNLGNISAVSSGRTSYAGGIAGCATTIEDCYNNGDIVASVHQSHNSSSYTYAGGVVGGQTGESGVIKRCYNSGTVVDNRFGENNSGRGIGTASSENCFFLNNSEYDGDGKSLTIEQMKQQSSFTGFDFENIWTFYSNFNDGFPAFRQESSSFKPTSIALSSFSYSGEIGEQILISGTFSSQTLPSNFSSIKWECSDSTGVTFGQTSIVGTNDNAIMSVPVTLNKAGFYTITAETQDGAKATAVLSIFDNRPEIAVNTYTNRPGLQVERNQNIRFALEITENGRRVLSEKGFNVTINNSESLSLSSVKTNNNLHIFEFKGLREGNSRVRFVEADLSVELEFDINIISPTPFYRCNHLSSNYFGISGLHFENFKCTENSNGLHSISFDVYNTNYSYGAIEVYDSNGNFIEAKPFSPYSLGSGVGMVVDSFKYVLQDFTDWSEEWYRKEKNAKHTSVRINVPKDGYFILSSDSKISDSVKLYNAMDIFVKSVFFASSLDFEKDVQQEVVDSLVKETIKGLPKTVLKKLTEELIEAMMDSSITSATKNICDVFYNTFSENGINFESLLRSVMLSLGYSVAGKVIEWFIPTWKIASITSDIREIADLLILGIDLTNDKGNSAVYCHPHDNTDHLISNGIIMKPSSGTVDNATVLHSFIVLDETITVSLNNNIAQTNRQHEIHNIALYKNGNKVQPSGKVTVMIPIPLGFDRNSISIYHGKDNGTWEKMDIRIEGDYIVFETGSFSLFAIVDGEDSGTISVSAGNNHTLALRADNSLWAWGNNSSGQIGDGTTITRKSPAKIMDDVAFISAGWDYSTAIKKDGSLWAWGANTYSELGDSTVINRTSPFKLMDDVVFVSAGYFHTMAIKEDGSLWAWGRNNYGQLGNGTATEENVSPPIKIMDNVMSVSSGIYHTAVVKTDGSLWAWGRNNHGQLGDGTFGDRNTPYKITDNVLLVSTGGTVQQVGNSDGGFESYEWGNSTMVIKSNGTLWVCGDNSNAHLSGTSGSLLNGSRNTLFEVQRNIIDLGNVLGNMSSVSAGGTYTMAVTQAGDLWGWGYNFHSFLIGAQWRDTEPRKQMDSVYAVSASRNAGGWFHDERTTFPYTMVIKKDGSLWGWGSNNHGQLANSTNDVYREPVEIIFPTSFNIVATAESNGKVTGGGVYNVWGEVKLTATPNIGYVFDGWYENDIKISGSTNYTFTAMSNRNISAQFTNKICEHKNNLLTCTICNIKICTHGDNPQTCTICKTQPQTCIHGNNPQTCTLCKTQINKCKHGNNSQTCEICKFNIPLSPCNKCNLCTKISKEGYKSVKGRILGTAEPQIFDVIEILKYLVKIDSAVDKCGNARYAALLTTESKKSGEPTIFDVVEVLKYLVKITDGKEW